MALQYCVMTEQEAIAERFQLLKEGEYDAVVESSVDKVSANSGNPMLDLTLQVFDADGRVRHVRDFLVFTKGMMWKVIHFAQAAGLMKEYEEGKLCSELVEGKRLRVKIVVEEGSEIPEDKLKGKSNGARYPDKNKVDDYIKVGTDMPVNNSTFVDDIIPF